MEQKIKVDAKEHALDGQNKMNSFRKEKKHCDFIIKVESEEIAVHRAVICSRSDYFDAMLSHDTKEKRSGVAEIKGVDCECTVKCVDFMYTGETSIKEDKCGELMHVATLFQLLTLCNAIAIFLEQKLDCKSFFATKQLADLYSCQKLVAVCNDFALNHFQEIAQLQGFKELDKDFIEFLLASDDLKAPESAKCKSAIEWTKHNISKRKTCLLGMLGKLDMAKIPLQYRSFLLENEPIIRTCHDYSWIVTRSILHSMNIESRDYKYRSTGDQGIAIFDKTSNKLQRFNVVEKTWTPMHEFNDEMANNEFSAVVLDEHLYVFLDNKKAYRIVHTDPHATWEKMASKNFPRGSVVVLDGMAYTLDNTYTYSNTIERFDPSLNKWQVLPDKTLRVHGSSMAVFEEQIFAISGYDGSRYRTEVERFDPTTSSWSLDIPLKRARYFSSAVTVENRIYVLGGRDLTGMTSDVEYRCPRSKTWITITPMKNTRYLFSSCSFDGKVYAIGGDQSDPKTIEEFDPEKNEWKVICQMNGKVIPSLASFALPL